MIFFPQLPMDGTLRRMAYGLDENPQHAWPMSTAGSPVASFPFSATSYVTAGTFPLTGADSNAAYAATDARMNSPDNSIDPALLRLDQQKAPSEAFDSSYLNGNGMFSQLQPSSMASAFLSDISICSSPLSPLSSCYSYSECESIRSSSPHGSPESSQLYLNSPFGPIETRSPQGLTRPYGSNSTDYGDDQRVQDSFTHDIYGHLDQAEHGDHVAVAPFNVAGRTSPIQRPVSALGSQFNSENRWPNEDQQLANATPQDIAQVPLSDGSGIFANPIYAPNVHFECQPVSCGQACPSLHQLPVTAGMSQEAKSCHSNFDHVLSTVCQSQDTMSMDAKTEDCNPGNQTRAADSKMILKKKQDLDSRTEFKCGNGSCDVKCRGLIAINEHMEKAHGHHTKPIPLQFQCWWPGCGMWKKNFADLDRHEDHPHDSTVKLEGMKICSFPGCGEKYDEKNKGDSHYNEIHRDPDRDPFPCSEIHDGKECDRTGFRAFRRPDHRKEHQRRMRDREEDKKTGKVSKASKSKQNPRPSISATAIGRFMSAQTNTLSDR